jgi:hypothetical protein
MAQSTKTPRTVTEGVKRKYPTMAGVEKNDPNKKYVFTYFPTTLALTLQQIKNLNVDYYLIMSTANCFQPPTQCNRRIPAFV